LRWLAITTCNASQWDQYGRAMVRTFVRHWPSEVPLRIYTEAFECNIASVQEVELDAAVPWLKPWKAERSKAQRDRVHKGGNYNYRLDAIKFAHKVAAIGAAADEDVDVLIWLDADIVTHSFVTVEWLDRLFPLDATIGWLGREEKYPEASFLMFRIPATRVLIREIVAAYQSGEIFQLSEWHDSFVIEHYVKAAASRGDAVIHSFSDLSLPKRHPFINCPLGEKMDHLKGNARKRSGKSFPRDLVRSRSESYWR
jgi:hypothetical protein